MANFSPKEVEIFKAIQELSERLAEDRLYEVVAEEIDRKDYDPVSKLKALEEAKGDEQLADLPPRLVPAVSLDCLSSGE
jgi:hypothetical protein